MIAAALVWLTIVAGLMIWSALEMKRPDSVPLGRSQKSGRKASYREARN